MSDHDMAAENAMKVECEERIAELEAERDKAERERFAFGALNKGLTNRIADLEAERDRLKAALLAVVESISHTDYYPKAWGIARAALSPIPLGGKTP